MTTTDQPAIRVEHLTKTFTGQRALDDVSFDLRRGRTTALLGMNGSGKSTVIKILAGVYDPDRGGHLEIGGAAVELPTAPSVVHDHGLRFLHQDLGLVDALTVADNFALVDRFPTRRTGAVDARVLEAGTAQTLDMLDIRLDPRTLIGELDPTTRTLVGIARAFQDEEDGKAALRRNILFLDEPTASLPLEAADRVLALVELAKSHGGTAVYVSHRIEEVRRVADHMIILRDGRVTGDEEVGDLTKDEIVTRILGKELERTNAPPLARRGGDLVLAARGLVANRLAGVDLDVHAGEIVGITGLVGCGRSELVRVLAGAQQQSDGTMRLANSDYAPRLPADAISRGVACVPQERRRDGVVLDMSVMENLTLGRLERHVRGGVLRPAREREAAADLATRFLVKTQSVQTPLRSLSGGNQQKVVLGRAAGGDIQLLVLDEASQGVDAIAKQEIANVLRELAARGVGIVLASTDYDDFVGLADRVLVLSRGRVVDELTGEQITEPTIAAACATSTRLDPVNLASTIR